LWWKLASLFSISAAEVDEAEPIMKLAQISPLYAEVIAPANMLRSVKVGDEVVVKPEISVRKSQYIGHVTIVDTVVDAASGTFGIRIELENKDQLLPAGLKCKVRLLGKQKVRPEAHKPVLSTSTSTLTSISTSTSSTIQ
jgi:hypothetical protein